MSLPPQPEATDHHVLALSQQLLTELRVVLPGLLSESTSLHLHTPCEHHCLLV